jgi:hypothetical protein
MGAPAERIEALRESAEHARLAAAATRRESAEGLNALHWHVRRMRRTFGLCMTMYEHSVAKRSLAWENGDVAEIVALELLPGDGD